MVAFLNQTIQEDEKVETVIEEISGATAPIETYELENGNILNVYEDGSIEPQLEDGSYNLSEEGFQVVIEDGKFKEKAEKEKAEPTSDPIETELPVVQEGEEQPEEQPEEDETKKALEDALAKIAELEGNIAELTGLLDEKDAKIKELEDAIHAKDTEIIDLKKQPSTQKLETRKADEKGENTNANLIIQALSKKVKQ